jgi:SCY1-like protein 2
MTSLLTHDIDTGVMLLIYSALGSEHSHIQERALKTIPGLCETLDYSTVQDVLLIKVAVSRYSLLWKDAERLIQRRTQIVFTKTRLQSIKVETLTCFSAMVPILDKVNSRLSLESDAIFLTGIFKQAILTQKLVPLLAKIQTKGECRVYLSS